jgi:nitrogen-specific signal transduction histidine kinase
MADNAVRRNLPGISLKIALPVIIAIGAMLFVFTCLGIQKSREDSLILLKRQGAALTEALALSADNAIKANSFFDLLVREKFSDMATFLAVRPGLDYADEELDDFSASYGVDAIFIFNDSLDVISYGIRGTFIDPDKILDESFGLLEDFHVDSAESDNLETIYGNLPGQVMMCYFEKIGGGKYIIMIVADALFFTESKKTIGIGYLVQNIGREIGIEYIFYQTPEGIIFSSRKIDPVLKIEKDPFLQEALGSDTALTRTLKFGDREVLELARSFHSDEYGEGVFRLGLSLEKYNAIIAGFDRQMIVLSIVIFAVIVLFMLYWQGKQKRLLLDRSMQKIQSLTEMVFDSITTALVVVKNDLCVETANRAFYELFKISPDGFPGQFWNEQSFASVIPFEKCLSGTTATDKFETEYHGPDGTHNLLINVAPLFNHRGDISGAVAIIYDYTQIKELEESGRRRQRLSELGDLAAGVAHEIRNPLNAISIAAQRLLAEFKPTENNDEFEGFVRQIKSEADRLNGIVTRFLSLARGEKKASDSFDLGRLIEDTVGFIRPEIEKKKVRLSSDIANNARLAGSPDRFRQALINLIKNAADACAPGEGNISIKLTTDDNAIRLSVRDNGIGIPDEIRPKIFNPYFTTKTGGTGLGLSVVHQVVEEFRGEIRVLAPPEGGTEFVITLPK